MCTLYCLQQDVVGYSASSDAYMVEHADGSEAHLHNIAKEAERRALEAEKAANRESATEAEKGEAAAARAAATAAWARADDSALRKSEAHLHNTCTPACTTCRGHGSGGARRFDQLSSTQIDAA